jgi:hypothetical protein
VAIYGGASRGRISVPRGPVGIRPDPDLIRA